MTKSIQFLVLIAITCLFFDFPIYAGGMISTGGGIFGQSQNPWFYMQGKNAKAVVEYCIDIDADVFPVEKSQARHLIDTAFAFWANEFSAAVSAEVFLARESFWDQPCRDDIPLRFAFGRFKDQAEEDQFRREVGDPRGFIAVAVRTAYDPITLKGRGFIYLAPDRGPRAMDTAERVPNVWSDFDGPTRILGVLIHELGHVFGIPHRGRPTEIMHEAWPERLMKGRPSLPSTSIFGLPRGVWRPVGCTHKMPADALVEFFGMPQDDRCLWTRIETNQLEVGSSVDRKNLPRSILGIAQFSNDAGDQLVELDPIVKIALTAEQKVFSARPGNLLVAASARHEKRRALYRRADAQGAAVKGEMILEIAPSGVALSFLHDGRLFPDASVLMSPVQ